MVALDWGTTSVDKLMEQTTVYSRNIKIRNNPIKAEVFVFAIIGKNE